MATITVRKEKIEKEKGIVILPIREYEKLLGVPIYYLTGKAAKDADKLVKEGLEDERMGRTIAASSVKEALRKYAKNRKR